MVVLEVVVVAAVVAIVGVVVGAICYCSQVLVKGVFGGRLTYMQPCVQRKRVYVSSTNFTVSFKMKKPAFGLL